MCCFYEGSVYSEELYTIQKWSHVSRSHLTSPEGVGVWFLNLYTLYSVCVCVWGGICIWDRGLWPLLLINPGTPASEIGQKVTTLLSKCSGQAVGAGNKITLISHPCKFVFPLFCIYTHVPQKGKEVVCLWVLRSLIKVFLPDFHLPLWPTNDHTYMKNLVLYLCRDIFLQNL